MAGVVLDGISKSYAGVPAVEGVDLRVDRGDLCAVLGPSGCGKTTLLRLIAGLDEPTSGTVTIAGRDVSGVPPHRRGVTMVHQEAALYPHLTAGANMAFPLRIRGAAPEEVDRRVDDMATRLGIRRHLARKPAELAAGHRRGVATGRALVGGGGVLLMDEPTASLDGPARVKLHADLLHLKAERSTTIVLATNDQAEAMSLADRIAVLDGGRLQQVAEPAEVYTRPANVMVAGFVGSPAMNFLRGTVERDGGSWVLVVGSRRVVLGEDAGEAIPALGGLVGRGVVVGVRPEDLRFGAAAPSAGAGEQRLGGEIVHVEFVGRNRHVRFAVDAESWDGGTVAEMVAMLPGDAGVEVGDHIGLAVDPRRLHLFDPADGTALRAIAPGTSR